VKYVLLSLKNNQDTIGSPGKIVEIDESKFGDAQTVYLLEQGHTDIQKHKCN